MGLSRQTLSPKTWNHFNQKVQKAGMRGGPFPSKGRRIWRLWTNRLLDTSISRAFHSGDSNPLSLWKEGLLSEAKTNKLDKLIPELESPEIKKSTKAGLGDIITQRPSSVPPTPSRSQLGILLHCYHSSSLAFKVRKLITNRSRHRG